MSLPRLTGTAKLLTDPKKALTKTGKPMATALLKFQGWRRAGDKWEEGDHVIAAAIAFEDVAHALVVFAKGDDVAVEGPITLGIWNDQPQVKLTLATVAAVAKRQQDQRVAA